MFFISPLFGARGGGEGRGRPRWIGPGLVGFSDYTTVTIDSMNGGEVAFPRRRRWHGGDSGQWPGGCLQRGGGYLFRGPRFPLSSF